MRQRGSFPVQCMHVLRPERETRMHHNHHITTALTPSRPVAPCYSAATAAAVVPLSVVALQDSTFTTERLLRSAPACPCWRHGRGYLEVDQQRSRRRAAGECASPYPVALGRRFVFCLCLCSETPHGHMPSQSPLPAHYSRPLLLA